MISSDPLELEVETTVSWYVGARNCTWVLWESSQWSSLLSHLSIPANHNF